MQSSPEAAASASQNVGGTDQMPHTLRAWLARPLDLSDGQANRTIPGDDHGRLEQVAPNGLPRAN